MPNKNKQNNKNKDMSAAKAEKKDLAEKEKKETKNVKSSAQEAKMDVVAAAREELERLERQEKTARSAGGEQKFPWGVFCGTVVLTAAVIMIGYKVWESVIVSRLEKTLPPLIELLGGGMEVEEIGKPTNKAGVYSFTIKFKEYEDNEFTSYITRDGKTFFTDGYDVDELMKEADNQGASGTVSEATCAELAKTDNPHLDIYVSSDCGHCQMAEEQIAAAVKETPALADYITLHYAGSIDSEGKMNSWLGGEGAFDENLRQICIRDEQADKYWAYMGCMSSSGDEEKCLDEAGVNVATVNSCMTAEDRGLAAARADIDAVGSLGIQGTPSFFVNDGTQSVTETDFGGRTPSAYRQMICCASSTALDFCDENAEE